MLITYYRIYSFGKFSWRIAVYFCCACIYFALDKISKPVLCKIPI